MEGQKEESSKHGNELRRLHKPTALYTHNLSIQSAKLTTKWLPNNCLTLQLHCAPTHQLGGVALDSCMA